MKTPPFRDRMNIRHLLRIFLAFGLAAAASAGTLTQTFEGSEDTSAWNSDWVNLNTSSSGFLAMSFGGTVAGSGISGGSEEYSRVFRDNTAGIDVTQEYFLSLYIAADTFDDPSNGELQILDGNFGGEHTANVRVKSTGSSGLVWEAYDNGTGWIDLGIAFTLAQPYRVEFAVNPATSQYSAVVHLVDSNGTILDTGSLSGLDFNPNVVTNEHNGQLLFYSQGSSGNVGFKVDNINISGVPEPSSVTLIALGAAVLLGTRRRLNR